MMCVTMRTETSGPFSSSGEEVFSVPENRSPEGSQAGKGSNTKRQQESWCKTLLSNIEHQTAGESDLQVVG